MPYFLHALLVTAAAAAAVQQNCSPNSIQWIDCSAQYQTPGLQCANFSAPLDWSAPCNGQHVRLALARQRARVASQKLGTLFFNTGGPGGAVVDELIGNGSGVIPFSDRLRDRFDIVAMDPRGVGKSQPILCDADIWNEAIKLNIYPTTQDEFDNLRSVYQQFGESCYNRTGPLLGHIDTRTAARDLEAVRVATGAESLNYIGLSYGTLLGTAYLELFPENIRTMILDGNVDHTQEQQYTILTESRTYENVLGRFFDWCDTDPTCAIHNQTFPAAQLWDSLITQAERDPIPAPECAKADSGCLASVSASDLLTNSQGSLVFQHPLPNAPDIASYTWPGLAESLGKAYYQRDASRLASSTATNDSTFPGTAVFCADWNITITSLEDVLNMQQLLNTTAPHTHGACEFYGVMLQCLAWPLPPSFPSHIPEIKKPSAPILLVNSYYDPESSYDWAVPMANEIPDSTLLTRNGSGHSSWALNGEAHHLMEDYLVTAIPPPPNTIVNT